MQRSSIKSSAAKFKTLPVVLCLAKVKLKCADMKEICEHSHDSLSLSEAWAQCHER